MNYIQANNSTFGQTLCPTNEEVIQVPNTARSIDKYIVIACIFLFIIGCYLNKCYSKKQLINKIIVVITN